MHLFNNIPAEVVAETMCVSVSSIYQYSQRYQATGDVRPFAKRNGLSQELCEHEKALLLDLSLAHPGIYLRELYSKNCTLGHYTGWMYRQFAEQYASHRNDTSGD